MTQQRRAWLAVGVVALAIAWLTLRPIGGYHRPMPVSCVICGDYGGEDFFLNVLLFVPLGIALRATGLRVERVVLISLAATVTIELLQYRFIAGRDATAGDVVANASGGFIGAMLAHRVRTLIAPRSGEARVLAVIGSALWLCTFALASWAFHASPSPEPYYGQHAPDLGFLAQFTGDVSALRLDGADMPVGVLAAKPAIDTRLARDSIELVAQMTAGFPSDRVAPIGSVFDRTRREVVLLGRDGDAAVFHVRLRADRLRLRSPAMSLHDAFIGASGARLEPATPVVLSGSRAGATYRIDLVGAGRPVSGTWTVRSTLGWMLLYPFGWRPGGDDGATALWLCLPALVLAYWCARATHGRPLGAAAGWLALAVAAFGGLTVIPMASGIGAARGWEWLSAVVGAAAGLALSRVARIGATARG